ncbi:MAG TPA: hypothetical protein VF271_04090 [Rhodanobacteraceae bacterium]
MFYNQQLHKEKLDQATRAERLFQPKSFHKLALAVEQPPFHAIGGPNAMESISRLEKLAHTGSDGIGHQRVIQRDGNLFRPYSLVNHGCFFAHVPRPFDASIGSDIHARRD